jgi:hypothetical protein
MIFVNNFLACIVSMALFLYSASFLEAYLAGRECSVALKETHYE